MHWPLTMTEVRTVNTQLCGLKRSNLVFLENLSLGLSPNNVNAIFLECLWLCRCFRINKRVKKWLLAGSWKKARKKTQSQEKKENLSPENEIFRTTTKDILVLVVLTKENYLGKPSPQPQYQYCKIQMNLKVRLVMPLLGSCGAHQHSQRLRRSFPLQYTASAAKTIIRSSVSTVLF